VPRRARAPTPGQGYCEAGERQVRGHHRILVIRRTGTAPDGNGNMARPRSKGTSRSWRLICWPGSPTASSVTSAPNQAAEHALALAEQDRVILPFTMTGTAGLLEALPRHQAAHAALLAGILDVLRGASPRPGRSPRCRRRRSSAPGELWVLRYQPTNSGDDNAWGDLLVPALEVAGPYVAGLVVGELVAGRVVPAAWRRMPHAGAWASAGSVCLASQCASRPGAPASSVPSAVSW